MKMRSLGNYKVSNPNDRYDRISKLLSKISNNAVFDQWGLKVSQNMTQVKGKKLYPAEVLDNRNNPVSFDTYN